MPDSTRAKSAIRALDTLLASRGWAVLREQMEKEIVTAAMQIAQNPNMTHDEINFRRGAIWAGQQLLETPHRMRQKLETERLIDESKSAKPD